MSLSKEIEDACETIDAAFFTGDEFETPLNLSEFIIYLERWERQVKLLKLRLQYGSQSR